MKRLRKKALAAPGDYDYVTSRITFCGSGNWMLQEYYDGRIMNVAYHREGFDISTDTGRATVFNVTCYTPELINPQANYNVAKDKINTRLRTNTANGASFGRNGAVAFSVAGQRQVISFRMTVGEYLILSPGVNRGDY